MSGHVATRRPGGLAASSAHRPALRARLFGLGSVFGKSLRDSRGTVLIAGLLLGGVVLATASQIAAEFGTVAARRALVDQMQALPPIFHGLLGTPVNIETLPGFISWRALAIMPVLVGLWSVVALSGTLAGEAARGTLELLLSTPVSRARLALQKFAAHTVALVLALLVAALLTWVAGVFGTLPGDEVRPLDAVSEFAYIFAMALLFGSIAFALGPLLGRSVAAGIGASVLFGSYVVNGYAGLVPGFDVLRVLSPFYWTTGHRPLAGISDWPAIGLVLGLAAFFAAVGVVLFQRRDLAATLTLRPQRSAAGGPSRWFGWTLAGPGRRSLAERLPAALAWGLGIGCYGLFIALSAEEFRQLMNSLPQMAEIVRRFYPGLDVMAAGGMLQLAMFGMASLLVGLAASTLVDGWAADETDRRLELVLAAPLGRLAWALRAGAALLLAVFAMSVVISLAIGLGVAAQGEPVVQPMIGGLVLGLYAAALAGIGLAVAGLGWPRFAGATVAGLAIGWYMLDFIGSALGLPDWLLDLALVRHLGQPMLGNYDAVGIAACAALAVGGLVLGALAFRRRDVKG